MSGERKTLVVFGAGKLGGAAVDVLATRYPQHKYVIVSRSSERAALRINLTRYICSQWGAYPDLQSDATDLLHPEMTAELLDRHRPDVVFNATTPFPWWLIDALPASMKALTYSAGLGMWCALDCVLPMMLSEALAKARVTATYVNGCYPDMVNSFLGGSAAAPMVGIGNMSNLVPGLTLAFAAALRVHPRDITIQLICHHFTSLNAPTVGGSGGAPYHLTVTHPEGRMSYTGTDDTPFAMLKSNYSRVRGLEGQGVTVGSATTVLASMLNNDRRRHHVPGPLGLVGGYPVVISPDKGIELDLPEGLTQSAAVQINTAAQQFDGLGQVLPGSVKLTEEANSALRQITGMELPTITPVNVFSVAQEIVSSLNARYALELRLG